MAGTWADTALWAVSPSTYYATQAAKAAGSAASGAATTFQEAASEQVRSVTSAPSEVLAPVAEAAIVQVGTEARKSLITAAVALPAAAAATVATVWATRKYGIPLLARLIKAVL